MVTFALIKIDRKTLSFREGRMSVPCSFLDDVRCLEIGSYLVQFLPKMKNYSIKKVV